MTNRLISQTALSLGLALTALPAGAQDLNGHDLNLTGLINQTGFFSESFNYFAAFQNVFDGRACIGPTCDGSEAFDQGPLRLKWSQPDLLFDDSSPAGVPSSNDWRLVINETSGIAKFAVQDVSGDTIPFTVEGGALDNTLWLGAGSGFVGFGTSLPERNIHIVGAYGLPGIRLDDPYGTTGVWDILANDSNFYLRDVKNNTVPFVIEDSAATDAFYIAGSGFVGIGTNKPGAPLEVSNDDSFSYFRITAEGAAVNQSADVTFTGGPLGTGQLRYNIVDGDRQEMSLDADGNMVITGKLTTSGPTCTGGCDAVLSERQIIPERDYSAQMWANGHLPHVGPTAPGEVFNVTEKMGGMLNALEHAHIYIERQNARLETQEAQIAALTALVADLARKLPAD